MMKRNVKLLAIFCLIFNGLIFGAENTENYAIAWKNGLTFLASKQHLNGAFGEADNMRVGYTALVLQAWNAAPTTIKMANADFHPRMEKAAAWLAAQQNIDGAIVDGGAENLSDPAAMKNVNANYCTAAALDALFRFNATAYAATIAPAAKYLRRVQVNAHSNVTPDNLTFGGFGYGSTLRPDLSNTWFALSALKTAGEPDDSAVFRDALIFVKRCQNSSEVNDQVYAGDDGGAMYQPGRSDAGKVATHEGKTLEKSFASMTCAMLDSYLLCGEKTDALPVTLAVQWLVDNWNLSENVGQRGAGKMGLYYYYRVLATALQRYGKEKIGNVNWREALRGQLLAAQTPEGFWVNTEKRFGEDNPLLCTAYALYALGVSGEK